MEDKCLKEKCESWCDSDNECKERYYENSDGYGRFLRGYGCVRDEGLKDNAKEKNPARYSVGQAVYYYKNDWEKLSKCKTIDEAIHQSNILDMHYWSPSHQYCYELNGENRRNEDDLFTSKEDCIKKHIDNFKDNIEQRKRIIKRKEDELEDLKQRG